MSLECKYIISKGPFKGEESKLYETLKDYYKERLDTEDFSKKSVADENEIEFKSEYEYNYLYSKKFADWLGFDFTNVENLSDEQIQLLNYQYEPRLFTLKSKTGRSHKYFQNIRGDKRFLNNYRFTGLESEFHEELTDHLIYQMVKEDVNLENVDEAVNSVERVWKNLIRKAYSDLKISRENNEISQEEFEDRKENLQISAGLYGNYFEDFQEVVRERVESLSNTFKNEELNEDEIPETERIGEVVRKPSIEENSKNKASANIKFLLSHSIVKTTYNENGEVVTELGNLINLPTFESFGKSWNILEPILSDAIPLAEEVNKDGKYEIVFKKLDEIILNRIKQNIHLNPGLRNLINEYKNFTEGEKVQFFKAFNKVKSNYVTSKFEANETFEREKKEVTYKTIEESGNRPEETVLNDWNNSIQEKFITDGKFDLSPIKDQYDPKSTTEQKLKLLRKSGIHFPIQAVEGVSRQLNTGHKEVIDTFFSDLFDHVDGATAFENKNLRNIMMFFNKRFQVYAFYTAVFQGIVGENTTLGMKGLYWNYTQPTFMHQVMNGIKQGDVTLLKSYENSPYAQSSKLLKKLQNSDSDVKLHTFLQMRFNNEKGKDLTAIEEIDDLIAQIHRGLQDRIQVVGKDNKKRKKGNSYFNMMASADKSLNYLISGIDSTQFNSGPANMKLIEYIQDELDQYHAKVDDALYEPFIYLLPEIQNDPNFKDENGNLVKSTKGLEENIRNHFNRGVENLVASIEQTLASYDYLPQEIFSKDLLEAYDNDVNKLLKDYVTSAVFVNVESTKVFTGYPGFYKTGEGNNAFADFYKRVPATQTDGVYMHLTEGDDYYFNIGITDSVELGNPDFSASYADRVYDAVSKYEKVSKDEVRDVVKDWQNNNLTDAQGWATIERARFILEKTSELDQETKNSFDKIEYGEELSWSEIKNLMKKFQSLKGVHFEITENGNPVYIKYSLFPLIPQLIENSQYENMVSIMDKSEIGELIVKDGVKVGIGQPTKIHNEDGTIDPSAKVNPIQLRNRFYKIQQELPSKGIKPGVLASQIQKTIMANLSRALKEFPDEKIFNGKTAGEVYNDMVRYTSEILDYSRDEIFKDLNLEINEDNQVENIDKTRLKEIILKELKRDSPENVTQAVERNADLDNYPHIVERIQAAMSSYFKKFVEVSVNQSSLIQVSNFGSMKLSNEEKSGIAWLKEESTLTGPLIDSEGNVERAEILMPSEIIEKYIPDYKERLERGEELPVDERMFNAIGYRIPNQGMSSNDALKIVGILPAIAGDTAIVYNGITTKTGSDFDIDKMYMILSNMEPTFYSSYEVIYETLKNSIDGNLNKGLAKILSNIDEEIIDNNPIKTFQELVLNKIKNNKSFENEQLDLLKDRIELNLQNNFKELVYSTEGKRGAENKLLESYSNALLSPYNYLDLIKSIDKDTNKIKNAIESKKVVYNNLDFFSPERQNKIKNQLLKGKNNVGTNANHLINHILTQLFNMNIDGYALNKVYDNSENNKIVSMLSAFLNTFVDIAKDDYILQANFTGSLLSPMFFMLRTGTPFEKVLEFTSNPAIKTILRKESKKNSSFSQPESEAQIALSPNKIKKVKSLVQSGQLDKIKDADEVEYALSIIKKSSKKLTKLMNSVKFEVNGPQNTVAKHITYMTRLYDLINEEGVEGLKNLYNKDTILGKRFLNGINNTINIDKEFFFEANLIDLINNMSLELSGQNLVDFELAETITRGLRSVIMNNFFESNKFDTYENVFSNEVRKDLQKMKSKYPDNKFLYLLTPKDIKQGMVFFEINTVRNKTKAEKDEITKDWEELLEQEPNFANMLIRKSFLQSGFSQGLGTFYEFIPNKFFIENESLVKREVEKVKNTFYSHELALEVVKNNIKANGIKFIKRSEAKEIRKELGSKTPGVFQKNKPNILKDNKNNIFEAVAIQEDPSGNFIKFYKAVDEAAFSKFGMRKYSAINRKKVSSEIPEGFEEIVDKKKTENIQETVISFINNETNESVIEETEDSLDVKEGVSELFESNPELANSVYEAMGFEQGGNLPTSTETINIYAGSNQNAELSNFAIRPFTTNVETPSGEKQYTFKSVEQGFHFYKALVANNPQKTKQILATTNGGQLKRLTNRSNLKMTSEQVKEWDDTSKSIMLNLMYDSYEQNPKAAEKLLATGDAKITHTQDNTRWKTDFPEVVMTVRDMLKEESFTTNQITPQQKQEAQQIYSQYLDSLNIIKLYSKLGNKTESGNVKVVKSIFDNKNNKNVITAFRVDKKLGLLESFKKYNAIGNPIDWRGFKPRFGNNLSEKEIKGINIYTKSSDKLGKRLTNPNWYAKDLLNVEALYKANASKIKAPHLNAEEALKYDMNLMYRLQVQKFRRNPELIDEINEAGGLQFIKNSSHIVGVKNSRWEGKGMESNFIKVLAKSYEFVSKELGKFQENIQQDNATIAFIDWFLGKDYTNLEQEYRQEILNNLDNLKGKTIEYYKELGRPSHATALDYLINQSGSKKDIQGFKEFVGESGIKPTLQITAEEGSIEEFNQLKNKTKQDLEELGNIEGVDNLLKKLEDVNTFTALNEFMNKYCRGKFS